MIFGFYKSPNIQIKNKPLGYWLEWIESGISFIDDFETRTFKQGDLLIVYNSDFFLSGLNNFIDEIGEKTQSITVFKNGDQQLLWVIPFKILESKTITPGNIDELPNNERQIRADLNVIPVKDQFLLENEIIRLQMEYYLNQGVKFDDFRNCFIEGLPKIGENTRIGPGVSIFGKNSIIGNNVQIYPNVFLENAQIGDNCILLPGSVIRDSVLEKNITIGPYAHLRQNVHVCEDAKIGNFVEMKKTSFGKGSKAMHLSYLGDAEIGKQVNIGAGTITCNYDGKNKFKTKIDDLSFIGSGSQLVAPVTVQQQSYVGAGSTITEDIPEFSLGISRAKQKNLIDWVKRKKRNK